MYFTFRDSEILNGKSDRNTVTILLLSHLFAVTVVTINTGSGSSDFPYLQRSVHKTAMRGKRCCTTVTQWLTFLGVTPKVRQVIAFPNVKKAIVHRITNEKVSRAVWEYPPSNLSSADNELKWGRADGKLSVVKSSTTSQYPPPPTFSGKHFVPLNIWHSGWGGGGMGPSETWLPEVCELFIYNHFTRLRSSQCSPHNRLWCSFSIGSVIVKWDIDNNETDETEFWSKKGYILEKDIKYAFAS